MTDQSYDLAALRAREFPWSGDTIWLDHASIGPLPERTRQAVDRFNARRARPFELEADDQFGTLARARQAVARLINAAPEEVALSPNTTFGIALAAQALPLEPGDVVLVSHREFPANVYPWLLLRRRGVVTELVPVDRAGWPDEERLLDRLSDPRVRVLAVSLTQFASGYTVDLARLSAACRRLGKWLVVDAIQAAGQLPIDVRAVPVDILAAGGQKWLLSPWGSGFVYVRRDLVPRLEPTVTGWMAFEGTDDFTRLTDYRDTLRPDARRFELITLPYQDFAGMLASLELLLELGVPAIRRHLEALHAPVLAWAERRGIAVTSPRGERGSAILCLAPERGRELVRRLRERRIYCSFREGAIRLSPHCYNTVEEMARVAEELDRLLGRS
ncbi:MAG TPA: aminotransferase class V-fold PLP-dependent enzyme [Gemmatimonadales bacterium]|nr:aminotransferase class V-fold PLP-dependent enzyme [Gemmatimonadales bacterium]